MRSAVTYPGVPKFTYDYTGRNQLLDMITTYDNSHLVDYSYDTNGFMTNRSLPNGTSSAYTPDALNRVTNISYTFNAATGTLAYAYDEMGNRKYAARGDGTADGFGYDANNQLLSFRRDGALSGGVVSGGTLTSYTFDASGNRKTAAGVTYATANNLNQYPTIGGQSATYGGNGNLATYNGWTYTYDAMTRLTAASKAGGASAAFYYDGLNRQVARTETTNGVTTTTYSLWDGWNLFGEYDSTGTLTNRWSYAGNDLVRRFGTQYGTIYLYPDGSGSTRYIADGSGNILERYTYDAYGAPTFYDSTGAVRNPNVTMYGINDLFTGQRWYPDLSLYDLRNRAYLPSIGRFLQPDPISFAGDPANLYRYCGNNPANASDPMGTTVAVSGDLNAAQDALGYLMHSTTFASIYSTLANSPNLYVITTNSSLNNGYFGESSTGGIIQWNPNGYLFLSNGGIQSPAEVLAHELAGHGYDYEESPTQYEQDSDNTNVPTEYDNMEEMNAVRTETKIAKELGESTRADHRGTILSFPSGFIPIASSISNGVAYYSWAGPILTGSLIPSRGVAPIKGGGPFDPGSQKFNLLAWLASYGVEVSTSLPTGPAISSAHLRQMVGANYAQ